MTRTKTGRTSCALLGIALLVPTVGAAQTTAIEQFVPVSDEMLRSPDDGDWLMWCRTFKGWDCSQNTSGIACQTGAGGC